MSGQPVEVLRRDPDLAGGIAPDRLEAAVLACRARLDRVGRGDWDPVAAHPVPDGFGLLLLSGFMVRRVGSGGRFGAELLGPGDLLRPWQTIGLSASEPFEPIWQVASASELAVLDQGFAERAAPYPSVALQLIDRAMLRSRHLALELAVVQQPRVDRRLHLLLWQLADRWGRTTAEGVRLEAPLTHALLAQLVAARRPSVTTALSKLTAAGQVERRGSSWILRGAAPVEVAESAAGFIPARCGETIETGVSANGEEQAG